MPSNDFLSFAGGSGANVLPQADYAALAAILSNGFTSGVAQSDQVNKVLRQASIMSAVLAQFSVDLTGSNAVDDGTTTTLLAMLKSAVSAQSLGVVGSARNLRMYVDTASASATLTADEIIVESALGGLRYCLSSLSKTINLATTGAGGMDTGSAPVSGFVALYAIYNPTTDTAALLATNAPSLVGNVYGGANMPAGYTASALVTVVPTDATGKIKPVLVQGRVISIPITVALTSNTAVGALTSISLSAVIPANAKAIAGELSIASTSTSTVALTVAADANSLSQQNTTASVGSSAYVANFALRLAIAQTLSWSSTNTAGVPTYAIYVSSYTI